MRNELPRLAPAVHRKRRAALTAMVPGPILLLGNGERARNLPMTKLPFRQDSTFLYFTGCEVPGAALLLDADEARLFVPKPADDDALWPGHVDTFEDIRVRDGVDRVSPAAQLSRGIDALPEKPATLAVADETRNRWASQKLGRPLAFGRSYGDKRLVDAVIAMRRVKSDEELDLLRQAAAHTVDAHLAVAASTRPGVHERALAALFEAVAAARGCALGYGTILTQRGEVLHNFHHNSPLVADALLLVDGGAEVSTGYGCDVTRTWPVSGRFTPRQRGAYEAVLEAQKHAIERCRAGVRYREVHDTASRVIARFLADEGLLTVAPDDAVEAGAHALFFPHGVGHLLGMDVHDLENFGDLPAYPEDRGRPEQFGTCYLRLDLPLEPGWVVTVEPGFYVVPAILHDNTLRERFAQLVDFERAAQWLGFGGIRIEDDIVVTDGAPENLTGAAPREVDAVEEAVGRGLSIGAIVEPTSPIAV